MSEAFRIRPQTMLKNWNEVFSDKRPRDLCKERTVSIKEWKSPE